MFGAHVSIRQHCATSAYVSIAAFTRAGACQQLLAHVAGVYAHMHVLAVEAGLVSADWHALVQSLCDRGRCMCWLLKLV